MNALATAPGVIATPGKYYIGAQEVMEYLDCKENKAYELIRQLRDELVKAGKLTPAYPIGKVELQWFFQETRRPIWESRRGYSEEDEDDIVKYGKLDTSQFSELELRMYILIKAKIASMFELKEYYTLDEALKLYALYRMDMDIQNGKAEEMRERRE